MRKFILLTSVIIATPLLLVISILFLALIHSQASLSLTSVFSPSKEVAYAALPINDHVLSQEITPKDAKVEIVRQFFHEYGSPLEPYAQNVVEDAKRYNLDFRLVPAIAMQESNLCHKAPVGSNNCWGFGIYGKTVTKFQDYPTAIHTVTETLAEKYKAYGLVTPQQIMSMYTPSSNGSWAYSVSHFMAQMQ